MSRSASRSLRQRRSMRGQLIILLGTMSALPVIILVGIGLALFHAHELPQRRASLAELAGEYTKRMNGLLSQRLTEVADLQHHLMPDGQSPVRLPMLTRALSDHPAFASVSVVSADGKVAVTTNGGGRGHRSPYAALVARALASGAAIGELSNDPTEGGLIVPLVARNDSAVAGQDVALVATLLWSELFALVDDGAIIDESGGLRRFVAFVDNSGRVLTAPAAVLDTVSPLQPFPGLFVGAADVERLSEETRLDLNGVEYHVVASSMPKAPYPWDNCSSEDTCEGGAWSATALMFEDVEIALAPVWAFVPLAAAVMCVIVALSVVAAQLFARRMTIQLDRLMDATEAIAGGHTIAAVPVEIDNDIGALTDRFNAMSAALAKSRAILQSHAAGLETTNRKLRELDDEKTRLLTNVSHEMRTPVTAMIAAARIIHRYHDTKPETMPRFSKLIVEEGKRLSRLVDEALNLATIESGQTEWHEDVLDCGELVAEAVAAMHPDAESRDIEIRHEIADDLPALVADPELLQQVLRNLIDNAIKFTPAGGHVTVRAWAEQSQFRFEVEDTGIGIAPEEQEKIFGRFYQVQDADPGRDKPVGPGLGLAICRDIVSHYGGCLSIDSQLDRGSVFRFAIPVKRADRTVDATSLDASADYA